MRLYRPLDLRVVRATMLSVAGGINVMSFFFFVKNQYAFQLQRYSQSRRLLSYWPFPKCQWGTAVQKDLQTPFCTAAGRPAAL